MSYSQVNTYRHVQSTASTSWVITHNLDTVSPVVDVWVDNGGTNEKIIPLTVTATSNRVVTLTFSSARAGEAIVA